MAASNPPSEHRWRDADLDNELLKELASKSPSEERIRELVRQGADVNSVRSCHSVLMEAIDMTCDGTAGDEHYPLSLSPFRACDALDERFVWLLVELGADPNWCSEDGMCALVSGYYTAKPALVERLLKLGADPNVALEYMRSLLTWVETDQCYEENQSRGDPPDSHNARLAKVAADMVAVLKRYGAKHFDELEAQTVARWLIVFAAYPSGLRTAKGNLSIEKVPGNTSELCQRFRDWLASHWDSWPDKDWSRMPKDFDREEHNARGREIARQIKLLVGDAVKVKYFCVCPKSEQRHMRNVIHEDVG
jgi:hypothetical protein